MHLMFSPRRQDDTQSRTQEVWFRQVNHGGVQPDASWKMRGRLHDVREMVALLTNATLSRGGLELAVDHRSLAMRGFSRAPARYAAGSGDAHTADQQRIEVYRQSLREAHVYGYEGAQAYAAWLVRAQDIPSLDRRHVLEYARDYLWRWDMSPGRQRERAMSLGRIRGGDEDLRTILMERDRDGVWTFQQSQAHARALRYALHLERLRLGPVEVRGRDQGRKRDDRSRGWEHPDLPMPRGTIEYGSGQVVRGRVFEEERQYGR